MPKIQWERLPGEKWAHPRDRARERRVSQDDLFEPAEWKAQDPDVPEGDWYEDFGTFKLRGTGRLPSTFPMAGQSARGKRVRSPPCIAQIQIHPSSRSTDTAPSAAPSAGCGRRRAFLHPQPGAPQHFAERLVGPGLVAFQRQYPLVNRIQEPGRLREEQGLQLRRGRDPIPRSHHHWWRIQIVKAELRQA